MSLDQFVYTPPSLEDLSVAVERAQKAAVLQQMRYYRKQENPSPFEYAASVRVLRHLTAIHRTLRKLGGPLFDPASTVPPARRMELLNRRIEQVEAVAQDWPESEEHAGDVPSTRPSTVDGFAYCPPEIEDLLSAVEIATKVSAERWDEVLNDRRWFEGQEQEIETLALRDLTAIHRTLRKMAGVKLAEDETTEDLQAEAADEVAPADSVMEAADSSNASSLSEASNLKPERNASPVDSSNFEMTDAATASWKPHFGPHESSLESVQSEKSVDSSLPSDDADIESEIDPTAAVPNHRPVRAIPPVPEIRPVAPSRSAGVPTSRRNGSHRPRTTKKSQGRWAGLYQEEDLGPWGIWDTPPPEYKIDESDPEFRSDCKSLGYVQAYRRARERGVVLPPTSPPILNDAHPSPDPPPD